MSNKLLKACSVLPVFAVCGMISTVGLTSAKAAVVDIQEGQVFENQKNEVADERAGALTISYGDSLSNSGVNNVTFKNNSSVNSGGAMKALNGFTAGDGWTFEGNTSNKMSGGLYVKIPETEDSDRNISFGNNTTFKGNYSKWLGGALGIEAAENFVMGDGALFEENSTAADGGAIAIWTDKSNGVTVGSNLTLGQSVFKGNTAANRGGAIANLNNDKAEDKTDFYNTVNIGANSLFESNSANAGGAIYNKGTLNIAENTKFVGNSAKTGGAIFNDETGKIADVSNVLFQGNKAEAYKDAEASLTDDVYAQGGAIYNWGEIGAVTGDFSNNTAHTKSETASKATANGGALALYQSTIESITGNFVGNAAIAEIVGKNHDYSDDMVSQDKLVSAGGGAIHIEGQWATGDTTKIGSINGNFVNNSATGDAYANGGAIYIKAGPDTDVSIDKITGDFINNKVVAVTDNKDIAKTSTGGAISIKEASDKIATVDVTGNFGGNSVTTNSTNALGGAVYNEGTFTATGNFISNSSSSVGGLANGGAIYNVGNAEINGHFTNNFAYSENENAQGGAIFNADSGTLTLTDNKTFYGNRAGYAGGAIYNEGSVSALNGMRFDTNISSFGGAIYNISDNGIQSISNSLFVGNIASEGGAINNQGNISTITENTFENNVGVEGAAIWNNGTISEISNSNFFGNSVLSNRTNVVVQGGAIYNDESGYITFKGNNAFVGNTASGIANDIHNLGSLTFADGTTTIDGGITGTGSLSLNEGATLNIGANTIAQGTMNINGNVAASIVNSQSYGKLVGDLTVGDSAELTLNIGATGVYDIFADEDLEISNLTINANDALYNVSMDGSAIVVETKAVEEIAAATDLTVDTAGVLAGLANSDSYAMGIASLNAQKALAEGNTEYVEAESAKLKADDKPVAHSVATSVQNQVLSLASGRMSGNANVGRSGGDLANADYGVWAQGLFNKSKLNGQFHGYTRGVAVGADALIDGKYTIGVGYAYNSTDVHADNARDTDIESNSIFVYGQYKPSAWYVNAALNYTMADYTEETNSFGVDINSEYDVTSFGGQVMSGYDFASGLTPEAGVRYLHISQDEYNNGLADINVGDTDYLTGVAGVKYTFDIDTEKGLSLRPELRAAATYDVLSDEALATVTIPGAPSYIVDSKRLSRFGGEFGIGLTAKYKELEISVNYDLDLHEDYTSQTGMLKFRYNF